ncbi:MAG: TonB family protein [Candidatus Thiodiazotropha endolucinida]|nr:TonB family protein [Candidatus Thiodiazotropha taylori]MCW4224853.1 TonB family protein [Candidatus Thiodiazotropha endolucinida]MCG7882397.1 TonB family protein [Candidatus Thiodiazotropha taylori]MCG7886426.1 TonB family protein [Candidatus Thiodiazotropha taylori]MCG7888940.1 TonB family protein [Candidatus Thiodiazotropha taylori]
MIKTSTGWRLLALSFSLLLHLMIITEWSDKMVTQAAVEQIEKPQLLVQLTFQKPLPEIIPEVIQPPKTVEKQVVKPKPKPKPKPKVKPKIKKKIRNKAIPKPVVAETKPVTPPEEKQLARQPPPPRVQPKVNLREQYLAQLLAVIEAKKTYPTVARRRNMEGKIEVSFNLSCDGKVSKLTIKGPHGLLRKAAGKAIDAAQPLPQPPSQIECPMPIHYAMAYTLEK